MTDYQIIKATEYHAAAVAATMRKADVDEVWAASRSTPYAALRKSMEFSHGEACTGLADNIPICMFGMGRYTLLSQIGVPWLLGTDAIAKHGMHFLRTSKRYIEIQRKRYSLLLNYVDARHIIAIRWVRFLGFELLPAKPIGVDRMPFHQFRMET